MIPSSLNSLFFSLFFFSMVFAMEKVSSNSTYKRPHGSIPSSLSMTTGPTKPVPKSSSMAFPAGKKQRPESTTGSLRGSIIKRIERSTSSLLPKSPAPEVTEKPKAPESKYVAEKVCAEPKTLIFGKPIYTLSYDDQELLTHVVKRTIITLTVSIQARCDTWYHVPHLQAFKKEDGHLRLQEILLFIAKASNYQIGLDGNMSFKQRELAASCAFEYIQKNKNDPAFNTPFYLVRTKGNTRMCVFESDLKKLQNNH